MGRFVLIVDDEFGLADVIGEVLTEAGFEVAVAINGEHALHQMNERCPQLVLLDLMMPILDGPATLARMRADPRLATIPVILMSALPEPNAMSATGRACQGFLAKPFSQKKLLGAIARALDGPSSGALRHDE